jgi:hypothetical protein
MPEAVQVFGEAPGASAFGPVEPSQFRKIGVVYQRWRGRFHRLLQSPSPAIEFRAARSVSGDQCPSRLVPSAVSQSVTRRVGRDRARQRALVCGWGDDWMGSQSGTADIALRRPFPGGASLAGAFFSGGAVLPLTHRPPVRGSLMGSALWRGLDQPVPIHEPGPVDRRECLTSS